MPTIAGSTSGHALLIGIDRYASAPPLRGCVNDVQLMASVLPRFGFSSANIRRLVDADATHEAILASLDRLLAVSDPGEVVVVHFSGWGARAPKGTSDPARIVVPWASPIRDGYPGRKSFVPPGSYVQAKTAPRENPPDEMLSALLSSDWDPKAANLLLGDEIMAWAARAVDRNLVFIFDAPYSGGLLEASPQSAGSLVAISASRADEICEEFLVASGVYQGALTYYVAQALTEAKPGETYRDVWTRASVLVASRIPYQHPQVIGDADAPLFTTGEAASARSVTVRQRVEDRVVLGVGAAQGATVRSQWAIYPPEALAVSPDTPRLGLVEITGVRATEADARVLSESARASIQPAAIALEEAHFFGEMKLSVRIETPPDLPWPGDELTKLVLGSDLLRLAEGQPDADVPDVTVHLLLPRGAPAPDDPAPQLSAIAEPTWVLVDRTARLVMAPVSSAGSGSAYEVRDQLESLSRYRNILGLRNPNPDSVLAGKVQFSVMRKRADGRWTRAEADRQDGIPVFHEDDKVALEIVNKHSAPIWVGVLDFGFFSSVSMVYPSEGASEQIPPNGTVRLWAEPGLEMQLVLPDEFHRDGAADDDQEVGGVETLKLFATVYPTDLGRLVLQEGGRGIYSSQGEGTALWQLLDMALTGVGRRELKPVQLPPEQEWLAVDRAFRAPPKALRRLPWPSQITGTSI